ncbi:transposase [Amycolatopsis sp. NPDC088138]|uniref:transposase n=1 Tax=Amycolatopsis sp. NPDC088138 TaxID=3363938 RepID=UPI0037FD1ABF
MQRQYSGTAGRIENCQIGTFLAYASPRGHALIDRGVVSARAVDRRPGSVPGGGNSGGHRVRDQPRQTMAMPARAFAVRVPFAWVTADETYGQVKYLRL